MTTKLTHKQRLCSALAELSAVTMDIESEGMPAIARFVSQLIADSDGPLLTKNLVQTRVKLQELIDIIAQTLPVDEQIVADEPQQQEVKSDEIIDAQIELGPLVQPPNAIDKDLNDKTNIHHLKAVPSRTDVKDTPIRKSGSHGAKPKANRKPSKMYDFAMFDILRQQGKLGRPVGMQDAYKLGIVLDELTKRGSHTSQMNRWKEDGYMHWVDASDITLTAVGEAKRKDLLRFVTLDQREQILLAYDKAFGISVSLD